MTNSVISVEHLAKRYKVGAKESYKTFREVVSRGAQELFSRVVCAKPFDQNRGANIEDKKFIWALRDVSFSVEEGEIVGVIGPNGAGKTTLLKILSRVTEPCKGRASVEGKVGSLLEVGTGFHPELTGRENIFLSGAILGMKRREIERAFDRIVDFSGVEKSIDTVVKRYSSGMYLRLAFSVAAHLEPEILLIDEILAVGDLAFQRKCLERVNQTAQGGSTVLFVSHNMGAIRNLCSRVLYIDGGRIVFDGKVDEGIQAYLSHAERGVSADTISLADRHDRSGDGTVRAIGIEVRAREQDLSTPQTGTDVDFVLRYKSASDAEVPQLVVIMQILDEYGVTVFSCATHSTSWKNFNRAPSAGKVIATVKSLPLIPGKYWIHLTLKTERGVADSLDRAASFEVIDSGKSGHFRILSRRNGSIVVPQEWRIEAE